MVMCLTLTLASTSFQHHPPVHTLYSIPKIPSTVHPITFHWHLYNGLWPIHTKAYTLYLIRLPFEHWQIKFKTKKSCDPSQVFLFNFKIVCVWKCMAEKSIWMYAYHIWHCIFLWIFDSWCNAYVEIGKWRTLPTVDLISKVLIQIKTLKYILT